MFNIRIENPFIFIYCVFVEIIFLSVESIFFAKNGIEAIKTQHRLAALSFMYLNANALRL